MALNLPLVSVVMPVYNAGSFVRKAVESILGQTYRQFEFLIYNDGSTDETREILDSFRDDRLRIHHTETNQGYLVYLNEGIDKSQGKYIARMDADDFSHKERLSKQVEFLEKNPENGLCSCWFEEFNGQKTYYKKPPVDHDQLALTLLHKNPFCHSSVMLRKSMLMEHGLRYDPAFYTSEDYYLWSLLVKVTRMHVIPEILHSYRYHPENISSRKSARQRDLSRKIQLMNLDRLGENVLDEQQREIYLKLLWGKLLLVKEFSVADELLFSLHLLNREQGIFEQQGFDRFIGRMGQRLLVQAVKTERYTDTRVSKFHMYRMLPLYRKVFMNFNIKI